MYNVYKLIIKLELYRAHTPRERSENSMMQMRAGCWRPLPTYYGARLCAWAEHIVGSVHKRGQQNAAFAMLVGLAQRFEAHWSQFFGDIDGYVAFTSRSDA